MNTYGFILALVERFGLVQAAKYPDRAAFHVAHPLARRKGVLTDIQDRGTDRPAFGYLRLTSLPDGGEALMRLGLNRWGTSDDYVKVEDLTSKQLEDAVSASFYCLTDPRYL